MSAGGHLHQQRQRASSFGDDAELYDRVRPPYPGALVDALLADRPQRVLDVGCGTGIASRLLAARGCAVLGVEPDPRMAEVARRRGTEVEVGTIEEWDPKGRQFDLLVAAQSWHWVDPEAGARQAASVLRPGGRIGLFWNQSYPADDVRALMAPVYAAVAPELGRTSVLLGQRDVSIYETLAQAARDTGLFGEIVIECYPHDVRYDTEHWLQLAATHSDHHTLPPAQLEALVHGLREQLGTVGDVVPVRYETYLVSGTTRPA
jgi:SAM-dependent methyltransferase